MNIDNKRIKSINMTIGAYKNTPKQLKCMFKIVANEYLLFGRNKGGLVV